MATQGVAVPFSSLEHSHVTEHPLDNGWAVDAQLYDRKARLEQYARYAADGKPHRVVVKKKRKDESPLGVLCAWIVDHQIGLSINLLLLLLLTHASFPRARRRTTKFFTLSYHSPQTGRYTQGWDDFYLVAFWIVVFTGLRAATMDYILMPLARAGGIEKKKSQVRFAEQAWLFSYYSVFWTLGMYIMYNSDYWFNLREIWTQFPTHDMSGLMKWYYMVQFAFWLQQIVVVHIEARRKDHWQMFTHHLFTSALIFTSYGFYQTKVGNVILCIMDVVDIVFPAAKMLKYLSYQTACDVAFGVFILTWFLARHVAYLLVCWSIWADVPSVMPYGCYASTTGAPLHDSFPAANQIWPNILQPFRDPQGVVCFNNRIRLGFLGLLLGLQVITLIWFGMIMRVAWGVLKGGAADDSRSDDEGVEEAVSEEEGNALMPEFSQGVPLEDPEAKAGTATVLEKVEFEIEGEADGEEEPKPLEEEVEADDLSFVRTASPMRSKSKRTTGRASGISIPGHGDHKELLGRIGCDRPL